MNSVTEGTLTRVTNLFKRKKSREFIEIKMISNSWNKVEGESISQKVIGKVKPDEPLKNRIDFAQKKLQVQITKLSGINENTPNPEGGSIERDLSGKINGRLLESATYLVEKLIPNEFTRSDYQAGAKLISEMLSKSGITSVTDAGTGVNNVARQVVYGWCSKLILRGHRDLV